MGSRRNAWILAISLVAHTLLLAAWLSTRAPPRFVEPPVMRIELIRPPPRERPKPAPTLQRQTSAPETPPLPPPILAQPAPPSPAVPATPKAVDTRQMTDNDILTQAGPKPDIAKLHQELAKRPLYSSRLPPGPDDCKPATERSNRIAPPCPVFAGSVSHGPAPLPNRPDIAGQAASRTIANSYGYRQGYGAPGAPNADNYPGLGCVFGNRCKRPDPPDPSGYDPKRPQR